MSDQTYILQELLSEAQMSFRTHNVKIDKFICQKDLPMMFLAHYDTLPDDIKAQKPLDLPLLKIMNEKMTASQACQLLGLPSNTITPATHIKISGTTVIVCDDFPLALHLQFTNTAKDSQALYGNDVRALVEREAQNFVLSGLVHVLHKNTTKTLISTDLDDEQYTIAQADGYTRLPNSHALATTHTLNTLKNNNKEALSYLQQSITHKILAWFDEQ